MNIRKGTPEDMSAVLGLIQELAVSKEPDAVLVTVEDLLEMAGPNHYFMFCCRKMRKKTTNAKNKS
jgi:hypothetical protein